MQRPEIQFINHSCFIYDDGEVRLISDPWLDGYAFDQGWALLTETRFHYEEFNQITHLWISHEHPDHFAPHCLAKIPVEAAKRIVLLFQDTVDKRVINHCRSKYAFKDFIELKPSEWYVLSSRTKINCVPCPSDTNTDSLLCLKTGDTTVLNLNDCVFSKESTAHKLKQEYGEIDVLLAQFSYAGWAGNPDEVAYRQHIADINIDKFINYAKIFSPRYTIPTASFVYFCHEENAFLNAGTNRVHRAFDELKARTRSTPIILYPQDRWIVGSSWDCTSSLQRYAADYESATERIPLVRSKYVPFEELQKLACKFSDQIIAKNNGFLLKFLPTAHIWVRDHQKAYRFSLRGLFPIDAAISDCDVIVGSEGLAYCFRFLWGGDTLNINGRFEKGKRKFWRFRVYFAIAAINAVDQYFNFGFVAQNLFIVAGKGWEYITG